MSNNNNNSQEYLKLCKEFKKKNLFKIHTEKDGSKYNQLIATSRLNNFWFWFGKKGLTNFRDRPLNNIISNFVENKFKEEKNNEIYTKCEHLNLSQLYRKTISGNFLKVFLIFYFLPFLYIAKSSHMKKFGVKRYLIFIPYLFSFKSFRDIINEYNMKKNYLFFFYGIEFMYQGNCEHKKIYGDFKEFCGENNLEFIEEK